MNIDWVADDNCASGSDALATVIARILRPEIFEARDRAEAILRQAAAFLPETTPKPKCNPAAQRIKELEAELALLRSNIDTSAET